MLGGELNFFEGFIEMLSLFANSALLKKFLTYVGLVPLVLRFIERAEESAAPGEQKKAMVESAIAGTLAALNKRGFLPEELVEGVGKPAGDLIDTMVEVYNQVGFFRRRERRTETPALPAEGEGQADR
jgi:hypothetical protein